MSNTQVKVGITLQVNTEQFSGALRAAAGELQALGAQLPGSMREASGALSAASGAAQALGEQLQHTASQGAQGAAATASATQATTSALSAASTAAQALGSGLGAAGQQGAAALAAVSAQAAPLAAQLQRQSAAQQAAAQAAQAEEAAQRAAQAARQQASAAQERFLAGLREQAELQGKTQAEVMRYRAAQLGVAEGAEPYIRALEQGAGAHMKGAMSAKEHAMAMRMLPMQMTDVVTSMASGMPVWMVAIQQGGQIKDSFHGVGNAMRAIVGAISPAAAALGTLAAVAGALALAYHQGSQEADAYRLALVSTGRAAGTTEGQLAHMAAGIDAVVGTQGQAAQVLALFVAQSVAGASALQGYAQAAIAWERASGEAVDSVAQKFASLADAPLDGALKLNEGMNFLTDSVYEQIKSLQEQGKTTEATQVAQDALADALRQRAGEMERNLGGVERAWRGIKDVVAETWDAIKGLGRDVGPEGQLSAANAAVQRLQSRLTRAAPWERGEIQGELARALELQASLESQAALNAINAAVEGERAERVKARAAADKDALKYLSDQEKMMRQIAAERATIERAYTGLTDAESLRKMAAEIEASEKSIRASYDKTAKTRASTAGAAKGAYQELMAAIAAKVQAARQELAQGQQLAESQKLTIKLDADLAQGKLTLTQAQQASARAAIEELAAQEQAAALREGEVRLAQMVAAARQDEARALQAYLQAQQDAAAKALQSVQERVDSLAQEEQAVQMAAALNVTLAEAIEHVAIARLQEKQAGFYEGSEGWLALQKEIDARRQLLGLMGSKEARRASEDAAKKAQGDWQKAADQINQSLTDALMRGFESGKDFAHNLRDTLVNLFKTTVLRPIISAVMQPVSMLINGAVQGGLSAIGMGGGNGVLGAAGNVASVAGLAGSAGMFGAGMSAGFSGLMGGLGLTATGTTLGGTLSAGMTAIGAGNIAAGLGTLAGALGPIALAIGALIAISKATKGETRTGGQFAVARDGEVYNQRRDQTYTYIGQQYDRDFSGGARNPFADGQAYRTEGDPVDGAQEAAIKKAVAGTADAITNILKTLGSEAVVTGFWAGLETSGKGRGGVYAGGSLSTGAAFGESGQGDNYAGTLYEKFSTNSPDFKTALENFTLDLKQATLQALQQVTDIPKGVQAMLKDLDVESLDMSAVDELLTKVADYPNQLLQSFGSSRDDLVKTFAEGLATGDAMAAGQMVADQFVAGVEASMLGNAASQIFDIVNTGIMMPILDAIATGSSVSEALAEANIEKTIAKAQETAAAFAAIWNDESFKSAMEQIRSTMADALGSAGSALQYQPRYIQQPARELTQAADAAAKAAEDARKKWEELWKSLRSDRDSAEIDLLRAMGQEEAALARERARAIEGMDAEQAAYWDATQAILQQIGSLEVLNGLREDEAQLQIALMRAQGDEAGALAREREIAIQGMNAEQVALYDSNRALEQRIAALDKERALMERLPGVIDKYLTPEQRTAAQYDRIAGSLINAGVSSMDQSALSAGLAGATKDEIAALAVELWNLGDLSADAKSALLGAVDALADLKDAAQRAADEAAQAAVQAANAALADLQRVVQARISELNAGVDRAFGDLQRLASARIAELNAGVDNALSALQRLGREQIDALSKGVDGAYSALRHAADIRRQALQEAISETSAVFEAARAGAQALFGEVQSTARFGLHTGGEYIANALANAQATGYLPDSKELSDAIAGAQRGLGQEVYASQADADFARLVLANQLKGLEGISGGQLTEQQRQLKALEDTLKASQDQLDALRGLDAGVLSVEEAVLRLDEALQSARQIQAIEDTLLQAQLQVDELRGINQGANDIAGAILDLDDALQSARQITALENTLLQAQLQVDELRGIKQGATSVEEAVLNLDEALQSARQITALEDTLLQAQLQVDAINGVNTSVQSVEAAVHALAAAMSAAAAAAASASSGGSGSGGSGSGGSGSGGSGSGAATHSTQMPSWGNFGEGEWIVADGGGAVFDAATRMMYAQDGSIAMGAQLRAEVEALLAAGQDRVVYDAIRGSGFSLDQADRILGLAPGDAEAWARAHGWPVFHAGTNFVPRTGPAVLERGEMVIPKAFNPAVLGRGAQSTERLERLVEGMVQEIRALRQQLDTANRHARRTADAVNGRPEAPMLVETT